MPLGEEKIVPFCAIRCWFKSWKKYGPQKGSVFWGRFLEKEGEVQRIRRLMTLKTSYLKQ